MQHIGYRRSYCISMFCLYSLLCVLVLFFKHSLALDPLHLLLILPLNSSALPGMTDSWERGSEFLAAAEKAVQEINQDPDILRHYTVHVSLINSMMCSPPYYDVSVLPSFVNTVYDIEQRAVVVAVGMFCPNSAKLLTGIAQHGRGQDRLNFPFFVGSLSPPAPLRNEANVLPRNQFHMLDSSLSVVQAVVSFMKYEKWTRIAVITDIDDTYYSQTAETFVEEIKRHPNISVSIYLRIQDIVSLEESFDARVVFVSASLNVSREVILSASNRNWMWPTHAWLFHTHTLEDLSIGIPITHLNGLFLFEVESECGVFKNSRLPCYRTNNTFADILYKSIVLGALVKNMTLLETGLDYITALGRISSLGLMDGLAFNKNPHTLFDSGVSLSQVACGKQVAVGSYSSQLGQGVNITNTSVLNNLIPPSTMYDSHAAIVFVIYYSEITLCSILVTLNLVLYIYYRKQPEVKATSFLISTSMFLCCYLLILYLLLLAARMQDIRHSDAICILRSWLNVLGIPGSLIVSTVLVKMLRVYSIFRPGSLNRIGKRFSDQAVFCYIILLQIPTIIIGILWNVLDPYKRRTIMILETNFVAVTEECYSDNLSLWPSLLLGYNFMLTTGLVIVAIKTRKIRKTNFKDTKKVNVFVFLYVFLVIFLLSLWVTARNLSLVVYGEVALHIGHTFMVMLVQVLLFAPKLYPPFVRHVWKQRGDGTRPLKSSTNSLPSTDNTTLRRLSNLITYTIAQ